MQKVWIVQSKTTFFETETAEYVNVAVFSSEELADNAIKILKLQPTNQYFSNVYSHSCFTANE